MTVHAHKCATSTKHLVCNDLLGLDASQWRVKLHEFGATLASLFVLFPALNWFTKSPKSACQALSEASKQLDLVDQRGVAAGGVPR